MIYLPHYLTAQSNEFAIATAIDRAATQAFFRQPINKQVVNRLQFIRGVQARIALAEMLSAIADYQASVGQAIPGLQWLI